MKPCISISTETLDEPVCLKNLLVVAVCLKVKDVLPRRSLEDGCSLVRDKALHAPVKWKLSLSSIFAAF